MSGIYGYIKNKNLSESKMPNLERLGLWNKAYGQNGHFEKSGEDYLLGCYTEKLHSEAACPEDLFLRGSKIWTIDAVLYNRDQICELLGNAEMADIRKISDEKLIINLIEKSGFEALKEVNGDFAGVVYDTAAGSVTMFRDHMGIRPLYYYVSDECLCFSTDLRGVLAVENVNTRINEEWAYRAYFHMIAYTSTSTEYKYIYCVRPASEITIAFTESPVKNKYLSREFHAKEFDYEVEDTQRNYWKSITRAKITEKKYWYLGEKKIRYKTEDEYCKEMRRLIEDSIRRRLGAFDGIAGAEFSGGLDSSLISILIKQMGRECIYCSWSNDPKEQPLVEEDERRTILEICERFGIQCKFLSKDVDYRKFTKLHERYSEVLDVNTDEMPLDKYAYWPMLNTTHLLNSATYISNGGGKVVFTGHGGDEGVSHRPNAYELIYHREIGNYIGFYHDTYPSKHLNGIMSVAKAVKAYLKYKKSLAKAKKELEKKRSYKSDIWQVAEKDFLQKGRSIKDIPFTFAHDVVKYILRNGSRNRMDCVAVYGAYCGVRYMFPYLDYRVIDYAVSIERGMYLRHGTNRYVLKNAFRDILPDSLLGNINKFDPSFKGLYYEQISFDEQVEVVKKRVLEFIDRYGCCDVEGLFNLREILEEINSKNITAENFGELTTKLEIALNTARVQVIPDRSKGIWRDGK